MLGRRLQKAFLLAGLGALACQAAATPWKIVFGGNGQTIDVDQAAGQHWLSISEIKLLGFNPVQNNALLQVSTGARTVSVPLQTVHSKTSVSLEAACEQLDLQLVTDQASKTLTILPRLEVVRYLAGHLILDASANLTTTASASSDGTSLLVTINGAVLSPDVVTNLNPGISVVQKDDDTVQFAITGRFPAKAKVTTKQPSASHVDINVGGLQFEGSAPVPALGTAPASLTIRELPSKEVDLTIPLTHRLSECPIVARNGSHVSVTLPGIRLTLDGLDSTASNLVRGFSLKAEGVNTHIEFDTPRPMGFIAGFNDRQFSIRLFQRLTDNPPAGSLPLLDRLIVVDPGHGGKDSGAVNSRVGIKEKTLTLQISTRLAETLAKQGAAILMTRMDDSYPTLSDRTHIANTNKSDLFLCVHINETNNSKTTGSITFCHPGSAASMDLAESIEDQFSALKQIPTIGVWYDTKIYRKVGFFVLRNTDMPAVLMELGFISNANDVKALMQPDFQAKIAIAIANGVEGYFSAKGADGSGTGGGQANPSASGSPSQDGQQPDKPQSKRPQSDKSQLEQPN